MISGTNQSKNTVAPSNKVKFRNSQAIYGQGIYGLITYGVGVASGVPTNQNKSAQGQTTLFVGSPIGLSLIFTHSSTTIIGSGVTNQSKN